MKLRFILCKTEQELDKDTYIYDIIDEEGHYSNTHIRKTREKITYDSWTADELRQIADKLDELNSKENKR